MQEKHLSSNHLITFHFSYLLSLQNHKLTSTHKRSYFHSICSGGAPGVWLHAILIVKCLSSLISFLQHCTVIAQLLYSTTWWDKWSITGEILSPRRNLMCLYVYVHLCIHKKIFYCQPDRTELFKYWIMLRRQRGENTVAIVRADPIGTVDTAKG